MAHSGAAEDFEYAFGMSYFSSAAGGVSSMRVTSSATLPWLMIKTHSVSWSGVGRDAVMGDAYSSE